MLTPTRVGAIPGDIVGGSTAANDLAALPSFRLRSVAMYRSKPERIPMTFSCKSLLGHVGAVALGLAAIAGCASSVTPDGAASEGTTAERTTPDSVSVAASTLVSPDGKGGGTRLATPSRAAANVTGTNGITYQGGLVMHGATHMYYIWYGNWAGNSATTILTDLASNIGGSPYFNVNTTYTDGTGPVANSVQLSGSTTDNYSQGTSLSDAQIQTVVSSAIQSQRLPIDPSAVYFVLTSADVTASSGFCTAYCGWHTHASISGADIKYAFIGNPDRCPSACEAQSVGPNGNAGADGMASVIAHELEESVTDPDLNAWITSSWQENADLCAWTFGTEYTVANGAKANMKLGARDFLIQQNWVNASGGYCALSYTSPPPPPPQCTPGDDRSCCNFGGGCGCPGDQICRANGTWGGCVGSTPRGHFCP